MSLALNPSGGSMVVRPEFGGHDAPRPVPMTFEQILKAAELLAKSGMGGMRSFEQAFTLMMLCDADGLHPMKALQRYHIIEGRPSMKAEVMLAEHVRVGGRYTVLRRDKEECQMLFWHPIHHPDPITITKNMEELLARGVGMVYPKEGKPYVKDTWKKFPENMLFSRAVSDGVSIISPGVRAGVYTPDETQDIADEERMLETSGGAAPTHAPSPPRAIGGRSHPSPRQADVAVPGQPRPGYDDRAFHEVVKAAIEETDRLWIAYQERAGVPAAGCKPYVEPRKVGLAKAILDQAVAGNLLDDPGQLKAAHVVTRLASLYGEHRAALREYLVALLADWSRDAQGELDARLDADRASAAAEAPQADPGDDLPPGRMPGED